jgi:hypothetical protein
MKPTCVSSGERNVKPEWVEGLRFFAVVALLIYAILLTLKARRTREQIKLMAKAYHDLRDQLDVVQDSNQHLRAVKRELSARLQEPVRFNYDLTKAPAGHLQLLTLGGARLIEPLGSVKRAQEMGIVAWAPAADRNKAEEVKLGLVPPP